MTDKSKKAPFPHPSFISEEADKSVFFLSAPAALIIVYILAGKESVSPVPHKPRFPNPFHDTDSEISMLSNLQNNVPSPAKQDSVKSKGQQRYSNVSSLEDKPSGLSRVLGQCLGLKKMKALKMKVNFGIGATQEYDKKFIRNYVSTTKSGFARVYSKEDIGTIC